MLHVRGSADNILAVVARLDCPYHNQQVQLYVRMVAVRCDILF